MRLYFFTRTETPAEEVKKQYMTLFHYDFLKCLETFLKHTSRILTISNKIYLKKFEKNLIKFSPFLLLLIQRGDLSKRLHFLSSLCSWSCHLVPRMFRMNVYRKLTLMVPSLKLCVISISSLLFCRSFLFA